MESHILVAPAAISHNPETVREQAKCILLCAADLLDNKNGIYAEAQNIAATVRLAAVMIENAAQFENEDK